MLMFFKLSISQSRLEKPAPPGAADETGMGHSFADPFDPPFQF